MNSTHLNEHDANQGAQSSGEFLGMTGNSGWYLLGAGGATIMMVIFLWGVLGVSLLLCLFMGIILCLGSVTYVFLLKNNKPEYYDRDFIESALVEAGLIKFEFGPRNQRPVNPFTDAPIEADPPTARKERRTVRSPSPANGSHGRAARSKATVIEPGEGREKSRLLRSREEPVVMQSEYESLEEKLTTTEEMLEEVLAEALEE